MQTATKREPELPYSMDLLYDIKTWKHLEERSHNAAHDFIMLLHGHNQPIPQWLYDIAYPLPPTNLVISE